MLRKSFHEWRIKQEIQKLKAVSTPPVRESPRLSTRPTPITSFSPLPPLFFYRQNFPPTSHFRFTHHSLSTSAAYYSRAPEPEPEPNTYLEDPNLNFSSLRESSDDGRENSGDGEGFCRRRTPPEERVLIFTCLREDGKCSVFCFSTKHKSQELSRGETMMFTYAGPNVASLRVLPCDLGGVEGLKRNLKVRNRLEVSPGDVYHVAMEELKKYQDMPAKEQALSFVPFFSKVGNKLEVLRRQFHVAYEEAMKYGVRVMMNRRFPVLVAMCDRRPLGEKIAFIRASIRYHKCVLRVGHPEERFRRFSRARSSRLWHLCVLQLLMWFQSGTYLGWKK